MPATRSQPVLHASRTPVPGGSPDVVSLRRWLRRLDRPDELADPELVALLRAHDRLPAGGTPVAIGEAAAQLLREAIDALRVPPTAPRQRQLPYQVLKACFLDQTKRFTVAAHLGMSERQMTRERTRALQLLQAQLAPSQRAARPPQRAEPIPRIVGFLPRPELAEQLADLARTHRLVHVDGPRGVGKTCLLAEYATAASAAARVLWYQLRAGLNDSLTAFLFDLVDALLDQLAEDRVAALTAALGNGDAAVASRLALQALREQDLLLVVDDYQFADNDPLLAGFLEEATTRLPSITVLTISRRRERAQTPGAVLHVPPMTRDETATLLEQLRIVADDDLVDTVHRWTSGVPQLITFAASWLRTATEEEIARGTSALMDLDDVQEFLLNNITDLIDPEDRHILGAASIFRDRFTDDALAYVAERSRGQVLDTSRRLVRYYLATRAHDGEVAFFHASVRDYIEGRLRPDDQALFHRRAATWYDRHGDPDEANHHREQAES